VIQNPSQASEQNDWQEFKPLFGGGKIKICDTLRAVTPFGGLSVLIEFFARIGLVEQLENRQSNLVGRNNANYQPQFSPNIKFSPKLFTTVCSAPAVGVVRPNPRKFRHAVCHNISAG
jgi:hypothetical protein